MSIHKVAGIEMFPTQRGNAQLDSDVRLKRCPFCGSIAGVRINELRLDAFPVSVECANTSCGVKTPKHYAMREKAIEAWNRRVPPEMEK